MIKDEEKRCSIFLTQSVTYDKFQPTSLYYIRFAVKKSKCSKHYTKSAI